MEPDLSWQETRWGRIDQARRELAVVLGKDVSVEKLAELVGVSGPSLWGWKQGSRPKDTSMDALERIFLTAGLGQYTKRYLDYGPDPASRRFEAEGADQEPTKHSVRPKRKRAG